MANINTEKIQPKAHRYRLYIDESGDHTYNLMHEISHRYLALLGVWFKQAPEYETFADDLDKFKRDIFGFRPDKPVILHRSDIINRKGPFGLLRDEAARQRFDEGLLEVIGRARFTMVCVVIDKQTHQEKYHDPFHPYHYCLAAMLDRYSGWLNYKNAVGDVVAEVRGKEEDLQLKEAYRRVYGSGTLFRNHEFHQRALTSKDIKLSPKHANLAGIQLADILAHPVKQAMLFERKIVPQQDNTFGGRLMKQVMFKFNHNEWRGQQAGYGKVWL